MSIIVKQEPPIDIPLVSIPVQETVHPPPVLEPVPFCTLCLRECPTFGEFYECNQENSADFCNSVREIAGIEFKRQSFNICKTCWKMVQMIGDFRTCCIKGQRWLERFEGGLGCVDDWCSEEMVQTIDYLQMVIEDHGKRFEESEPVGDEFVTTVSIDHVKVQQNDSEYVTSELPVETESDCREEMMEQDSSEDESLLQEMSVIPDADDEKNNFEISNNQSKTMKHEKQIILPSPGIIVNISKREVRDPLSNKITAIFDNEAKIFRCEICNTSYGNRKRLKYHLRSLKHKKGTVVNISKQEVHDPLLDKITAVFDNEAKTYRCEICDKNYAMRKCLRIHLQSSLKHQLKIRELLKNSKDRKKLAPIRPAYKCPMCEARMFKKESLAIHMKSVHSEAHFECNYCGQKFNKKDKLKKHMFNRHVNPKQFFCTQCGQGFWKASSLEAHMLTHGIGKRPYQCDYCERGYFREEQLERHMRIHALKEA